MSSIDSTTAATLAKYSLASSTVTPQNFGTSSDAINAMGYRTQDNFLYAIGRDVGNLNRLYKFDSVGGETDLGVVTGIDAGFENIAGAFASDGFLYTINGRDTITNMYKINIATVTATEITMTDSFNDMFDFGFNKNDGLFYGYDSDNGNGAGQLASISLTGTVTHFGPATYAFDDMGAVWVFGNLMYGSENRNGIIREFNVDSASPSFGNLTGTTFQAPQVGTNIAQHDGANCADGVAVTPTPGPTPELPDAATKSVPLTKSPLAAVLLGVALVGLASTVVGYMKLQKSKTKKIDQEK